MAKEGTEELKELVENALQISGVLGKIKSQLRASVFDVLNGKSDEDEHIYGENPKAKDLKQNTNLLATYLIAEFMSSFNLDFSRSVFLPEANLDDERDYSKKAILEDFSELKDKQSLLNKDTPILCSIIEAFLNNNKTVPTSTQPSQQAPVSPSAPVTKPKSSIPAPVEEIKKTSPKPAEKIEKPATIAPPKQSEPEPKKNLHQDFEDEDEDEDEEQKQPDFDHDEDDDHENGEKLRSSLSEAALGEEEDRSLSNSQNLDEFSTSKQPNSEKFEEEELDFNMSSDMKKPSSQKDSVNKKSTETKPEQKSIEEELDQELEFDENFEEDELGDKKDAADFSDNSIASEEEEKHFDEFENLPDENIDEDF